MILGDLRRGLGFPLSRSSRYSCIVCIPHAWVSLSPICSIFLICLLVLERKRYAYVRFPRMEMDTRKFRKTYGYGVFVFLLRLLQSRPVDMICMCVAIKLSGPWICLLIHRSIGAKIGSMVSFCESQNHSSRQQKILLSCCILNF